MGDSFHPDRCDLCGSGSSVPVARGPGPRSMRSDRLVVERPLVKLGCLRCGLVRSGERLAQEALRQLYAEEYAAGLGAEHLFYTPGGTVARSEVFRDWLVEGAGNAAWEGAARILEIGAGSGALMSALARRFPAAAFAALGPGREDAGTGYDLAYSVAVIEHVPSPTDFLDDIRRRLPAGGRLLLSQPTLDVTSYDLFFVDHLHHFAGEHLRQYALKCGFREEHTLVGHPLMPNFSLHVWVAAEPDPAFEWAGPPAGTAAPDTARRILEDMARLDVLLARLEREGRPVAVFGLGEVYWLARAYSSLGGFRIVCGLDDAPDQPGYARLGFPVVRPEGCPAFGVQDVILAMNRVYYAQAEERVRGLGLRPHPLLS
jgi:SAM-dependent methyltransferase